MKIKVQCPCGARFEFEAEPINGRMPMAINCPTCGNDATALANAVIQQQSPAVASPPIPPPAGGLRISKSHAAPAAQATTTESVSNEIETPPSVPCPKHKTEPAVETCCVCGKPICLKCMEQFGYVCSVYCRQQATQKRIYVPVYAHQKSIVAGKSHVLAKRLTLALSLFVVLIFGFWFWYVWFARDYKIVYTLHFSKPDLNSDKPYRPEGFYQLIGPGQFLSIKDQQLSLFDVAQEKQIWSTSLAGGTARYDFDSPNVITTTNDIWVSFPDRLARFDRATGSPRNINIKDKILSVTSGDDAIVVLSGTAGGIQTLTKINLPGGDFQTEAISNAAIAEASGGTKGTNKNINFHGQPIAVDNDRNKVAMARLKALTSQSAAPAEPDDDAEFARFDPDANPFIADGASVVQFETKVLEHKTISHVAMKAKGKSVLDSENLTADQSVDAVQEMMNDSRREATGGVDIEDVSRYQITLHRHFAPDVPDWTGEVIGPPRFYTLKTVDILCAGQIIYVFDKNNKKLWDAKLTFSVANRFKGVPCLETKDALYFADLGMLTRYDLATGNVRWRFNTVGISKIQTDARGSLYVNTTTAGPESIRYSQQINLHDKIHPVIVKLDPATSKVLWRLESIGDTCLLSGKFLYSTMTSTAMAALHLEDGPDLHFYLNLLDPANGKEIWSFHRGNQHIIKTDVQKNWILLQFQEELIVLKFFSL